VRELTVGTGAGAAQLGADVVLPLGPLHPSAHGVLQVRLTVDGDTVVTAEPVVGFMHRGAEKLFEVRDYRQITVLANRHDWLSAFGNELGVVGAVERMLGLEVPPRAIWLRTLLAELNRVLNHLMFLAGDPPSPAAHEARETLQAVLEEASGGRIHYMANRVGGLKEDVPAGWTDRVRRAIAGVRARTGDLTAAVDRTPPGVGVLTAADARAYGVSGPVARASGVDFDLRRDEPYLAYGELPVRVVTRRDGDARARYECLLEQVHVSLDLADAVLDRLPALTGPVNVRLPKTVKAPEGAVYEWTENPLGINGYYLVSRGERTPWRLKLRSASFNNVQALAALLPGTKIEDLVAVLGSLFFVVGDIDR
jgi:NADH-quinone oxidoreductase subunit D